MSTCSTATSARRGHESRRRAPPACDAASDVEAIHGRLERRLVDLERDWDTYKTAHPGAPRHRRSRSATGTPSSAVTVAAPDGLLLPLLRCSSPRRLVSSLQRTGSTDSDCAAKNMSGADSPTGSIEEGRFSVCSVEGRYSVADSSSSCSCPCRCAVCCGYSASSAAAAAAAAVAPARKIDGGSWVAGRGRAIWISAIALVLMGFVVMVILELRVNKGCAEYLVPT